MSENLLVHGKVADGETEGVFECFLSQRRHGEELDVVSMLKYFFSAYKSHVGMIKRRDPLFYSSIISFSDAVFHTVVHKFGFGIIHGRA